MIWKKLHHAMHGFGQTAFVVGAYSWSEGKAMKLFPLNEFTRIIFSDELAVQMVDVIEVTVPQRCTVPLCISGFSLTGDRKTLVVFGGIPFPKVIQRKEKFAHFPASRNFQEYASRINF